MLVGEGWCMCEAELGMRVSAGLACIAQCCYMQSDMHAAAWQHRRMYGVKSTCCAQLAASGKRCACGRCAAAR